MAMAFSVTEALIGHINGMGYRASSRAPRDAGGPFVTVERTGGGVADMLDHPIMAVQAWAQSEDAAEEMANALRYRLVTEPPPSGIRSIRVNSGPYQFYDEFTRMPRYQLVLDVTCGI